METRSIQIPFCGFYESSASQMIDDEIEQSFYYGDSGDFNAPDDVYWKADFSDARLALVKAYVDAFADRFEGETGIALNAAFEEMTSPREYNFSTDRVFALVPLETVITLFTESEKDNHTQLALVIKDNCTSYDGFWSHYTNDLAAWLLKPVGTWDHNELSILLQAVAAIHCDTADWHIWDLLDAWRGNGGLSNAVWDSLTPELKAFADIQREYGKAVDYDLWLSSGKCFPNGTTEEEARELDSELPLPRCDKTLELPL